MTTDAVGPGGAAWSDRTPVAWAEGIAVPDYLALRQGARPLIIVAPHGGRRRRAIRRGDNVNDLHTADIAWQLAGKLDAHAIVNHSLDRNEIDLNRITHLTRRAPDVLALLSAAIEAASGDGQVPLVLFVHGWNMVVPCCDIGIGIRRRGGRLTGRYPTLSRARYDATIAAIERELDRRGLSAAIGRRYTASGSDNAAQLFSGRHAEHDHEVVSALGRLSVAGRVDAAQLELGIPLRWPGARREALIDGLVAALDGQDAIISHKGGVEPRLVADAARARDDFGEMLPAGDPIAVTPRPGWTLSTSERGDASREVEPGFALQAVLDRDGSAATFCGVEATGPRSMAARFSVVCSDGSMMLLVGEGEWDGQPGRYGLEGFGWHASDGSARVELNLRAPMIRYPTHDAYLDLETGLAGSLLVDAEVELAFEALSGEHGRLRGSVRAGGVSLQVDTVAFLDRGGRRSAEARQRLRVVCALDDGSVAMHRSATDDAATLRMDRKAGPLGIIRAATAVPLQGALHEAEIVARVPVWRPVGDGVLVRWTFGIVRCRHAGSTNVSMGLFESLEIFRRPVPIPP